MPLLIIDSSYLVFRSFFAYPSLTSAQKEPTGAIYGFAKTIMSLIKEYRPEEIIFAKDTNKPTWRHKVYSGYKAGRPEPDPAMIAQFPVIYDWIERISKNSWVQEGYEADDFIFTGAVLELGFDDNKSQFLNPNFPLIEHLSAVNNDKEVLIFSSDRDLYQLLVFPQIKFLKTKKTGQTVLYGQTEFIADYGILPIQWLDFKAIVGDSSDNLIGISGVGPKTATKILNGIGNLKAFYESNGLSGESFARSSYDLSTKEEISLQDFNSSEKTKTLKEKLLQNYDQLKITYELGKLHFVDGVSISKNGLDLSKGYDLFEKYNFKSLLPKGHNLTQNVEQQETLF